MNSKGNITQHHSRRWKDNPTSARNDLHSDLRCDFEGDDLELERILAVTLFLIV